MRAFSSKRLRQEDGIALVLALGITSVLIIFVASMIDYTTSNSRAARLSTSSLTAMQYADAGLNTAYSILVNQKVITGGNPTAANLLGCNGLGGAADTNGPSNCATPVAKVVCVTTAGCVLGDPGSSSVYGYYSGTNPTIFNGVSVDRSQWLLVSSGYERNPQGSTVIKTTTAKVTITALNSGAVAAVWNHMFITAPLTPNVCAVDFAGNNTAITSPLYAIGNVCVTGANVSIQESPAGQPIDLMVGGKLVLSGSGTKAGTDAQHPLTSGVVVGGCTTVSVSSATTACDSGSYNYWVGTKDTFVLAEAPEMLAPDILIDYTNSDPGPKHACVLGGLPTTTFDGDTTQNGTNASFELLPNSSYTCISQNGGAATGVMSWNNSTKLLTINGNVFLDGNLTISQSGTYTGTGVIEAAGTITFNGNSTQFCATSPCSFTTWQGSSTNTSMLTLVALKSNATSITFTDNAQTFQGSIWCQPSSSMTFVKNGVTIEGPISIGKFDATFNNASFQPLPVIKNMPVGAPIPPNTGASIGTLTITK
jgi:Tfp pilus assembly protein PilX